MRHEARVLGRTGGIPVTRAFEESRLHQGGAGPRSCIKRTGCQHLPGRESVSQVQTLSLDCELRRQQQLVGMCLLLPLAKGGHSGVRLAHNVLRRQCAADNYSA
jgi:hypothetical protein